MRDGTAVPNTLSATMANAIRALAERWLSAEFCGAIVDHYSCVDLRGVRRRRLDERRSVPR